MHSPLLAFVLVLLFSCTFTLGQVSQVRSSCEFTELVSCTNKKCENDGMHKQFLKSCLIKQYKDSRRYGLGDCANLCSANYNCLGYIYKRTKRQNVCELYDCDNTSSPDTLPKMLGQSWFQSFNMRNVSRCNLQCRINYTDPLNVECPDLLPPVQLESPPDSCDAETIRLNELPSIVKYDENGFQRTPVMGFNTYFWLLRSWDADMMLKIADDFKEYDYQSAGYDYMMVDGGWWNGVDWAGPLDPPEGALLSVQSDITDIGLQTEGDFIGATKPDPLRFPNGVKDLVDKLHGLGYKYGHYHNAGKRWCNNQKPSGYGKAEVNIAQMISWEIDYLKLDGCDINQNIISKDACSWPFKKDKTCAVLNPWVTALSTHSRPVLLNNCRIGCMGVQHQSKNVRCDFKNMDDREKWSSYWKVPKKTDIKSYCSMTYMARTSPDTIPCWGMMMTAIYAGLQGKEGMFYDPDSILIGLNQELFTHPDPDKYGLTYDESVTNFALFAIMSYPLIIATDVSTLPDEYKEILQNPYAIFINQNIIVEDIMPRKLRQGFRIYPENVNDWRSSGTGYLTIWWKPLDDEYNAFLVLNQGDNSLTDIEIGIGTQLHAANRLIGKSGTHRQLSPEYQVLNVFTADQYKGKFINIDELRSHQSHLVLVRTLCQE